jgi:hypothetical protein
LEKIDLFAGLIGPMKGSGQLGSAERQTGFRRCPVGAKAELIAVY